MLSVICVFNDKDVLEKTALKGLANQTSRHEIIAIDNRDSSFSSAASALNHGARQAKGSWLLFIHQDVLLLSDDWLESAEKMLDRERPGGWAGVAGCDAEGRIRGFMLDRASLLGNPFDCLLEVQTLDECLLIHRNDRPNGQYFDESVPGWHAYGVEACCAAIQEGKKNYVLPLPVWHDSKSTNLEGLAEAHQYVWRKHGARLGKIYTTCGSLPDLYEKAEPPKPTLGKQVRGRLRSLGFRLSGVNKIAERWFEDELESMTEEQAMIECLHRKAAVGVFEARAFIPQPKSFRTVRHLFEGLVSDSVGAECVVVAPDLTEEVLREAQKLDEIRRGSSRVIACIDMDFAWKMPFAFRRLMKRVSWGCLSYTWSGTPVIIATL
ncbi:MAG: glycosyltransferase [Blastocatellia bacterium]